MKTFGSQKLRKIGSSERSPSNFGSVLVITMLLLDSMLINIFDNTDFSLVTKWMWSTMVHRRLILESLDSFATSLKLAIHICKCDKLASFKSRYFTVFSSGTILLILSIQWSIINLGVRIKWGPLIFLSCCKYDRRYRTLSMFSSICKITFKLTKSSVNI